MKTYNDTYSYEILEDGYNIYQNGKKWIAQHEPNIPYPKLSYEENCLMQIKEVYPQVEPKENEFAKLRADVDYIAFMTDVDLGASCII